MLIPSAAQKIAAHRAAAAVRSGRAISRSARAAALGIQPAVKDLNQAQKARMAATKFYKGHKKMVIGAGAVGMAGMGMSTRRPSGSPSGTQQQARGIYGF